MKNIISLLFCVSLFLIVGAWGVEFLFGQPLDVKTVQRASAVGADEKIGYQGNSRCVRCHESPSAIDEQSGVTKFLRMNESQIWSSKDKHALAFVNVIETDLGKKMLERLDIPVADFVNSRQCTSCHSNPHWIENNEQLLQLSDETLHRESGVSCESCHGPSLGWDLDHTQPAWRKLDSVSKNSHGMLDMRNPRVKAGTCYSCHIGNVKEGKVVTHDMYVAGHPPLPSVELDVFLQQMPPHWVPIEDKGDFHFRSEFVESNRLEHLSKPSDVAKHAALASLTFVQLVQDVADSSDKYAWPELALYDCFSCHHELKTPHWRNNVFSGLKPGRPYFQLWPNTLVDMMRSESAQSESLDFAALKLHLNQRPFGDPVQVSTSLEKVRSQLQAIVRQLEEQELEIKDSRAMILQLCRLPEQRTLDFQSARQLAWALKVLLDDISSEITEEESQKIATHFGEIDIMLSLTFPNPPERTVEKYYLTTLTAISSYSPDAIAVKLSAIASLVSKTE